MVSHPPMTMSAFPLNRQAIGHDGDDSRRHILGGGRPSDLRGVMTLTPDLLRQIPLFDDLHEAELLAIMGCFSEVTIAPGETLYVEGDAADSACFVIDGELEALKALPGGDSAQLGMIGSGGMIGEMALVAGGVRSATVRANTECTILNVSQYFFHAALDQMSAPAFKILRHVIHGMTMRLETLQRRILEQWDCESVGPASAPARGLPEPSREPTPSFDYQPFLPIIPFFEEFRDHEIDRVVARAKVLELPRNEYLFREGTQAAFCSILVHGAIEISVLRDRRYQLSVLGPGRLCGANALIAKSACGSDARVRSSVLLLCFDELAFRTLYKGETTECMKFQRMVGVNQLQELKAADNLLATLVSQDHVLDGAARSRSL